MLLKQQKETHGPNFFQRQIGKEVFQAYKYTKSRLMEKIPSIQTTYGKLCHNFNEKCPTFIKAMYPKPPKISQNTDIPNATPRTLIGKLWQGVFDWRTGIAFDSNDTLDGNKNTVLSSHKRKTWDKLHPQDVFNVISVKVRYLVGGIKRFTWAF